MEYDKPSRPSLMTYINQQKRREEILEEDRIQRESRNDLNYSTPPNTNPDSPPKPKSHYFVQNYDLKDGMRSCRVCGKEFKPYNRVQVYCSQDCYNEAMRTRKAVWYTENRERLQKKQLDYYYRNKKTSPPKVEFKSRWKSLLMNIEFKKCIIIKRELIRMELLSCQLLTKQIKKKNKKNYRKLFKHARQGVKEDKVNFIKQKLAEFDLPEGYSIPVDFPADPDIDIQEFKSYGADNIKL